MAERIRILATSDLHGSIYPYDEITGAEQEAGLGRIQTLVSFLRDDHTLLLDNGDAFAGSPMTSWHQKIRPDEIMPVTEIMREMNYDYINLGNHDFSCGEEALMIHVQNIKAPCLTNNVLYHGKPFGPTYAVQKVGEYKVAVFAVTTPIAARMEPRRNIRHFQFKDAYTSAQKAVSAIRRMENPDLVICLYHGGFEKDPVSGESFKADPYENEANAILSVPGIDVLITGHQHLSLKGKLLDTVYVQTESHGRQLACIDFYPRTKDCEVRLLNADTDADDAVTACADEEYKASQEWLDEQLAVCRGDFSVKDPEASRMDPSGFVSLMNQIQKEITGAQLSAYSFSDSCRGLPDTVTRRDLFTLGVPFTAFVVKKITGAVLREYLEKSAEYWTIRNTRIHHAYRYETPKPLHTRYDMVSGIDYTVKVTNDLGHRIVSLTYQGEEVTDNMEFTICLNRYRASGGGEYPMLRDLPVCDSYTRDIMHMCEEYFKEHPVLTPVQDGTVTLIK